MGYVQLGLFVALIELVAEEVCICQDRRPPCAIMMEGILVLDHGQLLGDVLVAVLHSEVA